MNESRERLLAKVAFLYYVKGYSQSKISSDLNIYRTTISRMIKEARDCGLVEINIRNHAIELFELEEYFKKKYHLKKIVIVDNQKFTSKQKLEKRISQLAAFIIRELLTDDCHIGISWGAALSNIVNQITPKKLVNTSIVPLAGGPSNIKIQYHVNTLVYELSKIYQSEKRYINAKVVQNNTKDAQTIFKQSSFIELQNEWDKLDLAIMGVGGDVDYQFSQWRDLLQKKDYAVLKEEDAIGEICCRFFNADGELVHKNLQERIIGISFDQLLQIKDRVAVAHGKSKEKALLAILKKQMINHLVTDLNTAIGILALDHDNEYKKFC